MLVDPLTHDCALATDEAKEAFIRNGFSLFINPDDEMSRRIQDVENAALAFGTALSTNLKATEGEIIPNKNLPFWVRLVPFQVAFGTCTELKRRQPQPYFMEHLVKHEIVPRRDLVREDVWQHLERMNQCRVYELRGWGIVFHVYAMFVTPVKIVDRNGVRRLVLAEADVETYTAVADFVKKWKKRLPIPRCRCLSLGSFMGWTENLDTVVLPDSIQVLSSPVDGEKGAWIVRHSSLEHMRPVYRRLVYSLYPETPGERYQRIKQQLESSFSGSMTVVRMAHEAHIPQDCVATIFDKIIAQDKKRWCAYETGSKELAIGPRRGVTPVKRKFAASKRSVTVTGLLVGIFIFFITAALTCGVRLVIHWRAGKPISFEQVVCVVIPVFASAAINLISNDIKTRIKED